MARPGTPADDALLELLSAAVTARMAAGLQCPHLATRATQRAAQVALRVIDALALARTEVPQRLEDERLDGVRTNEHLCQLIGPPVEEASW